MCVRVLVVDDDPLIRRSLTGVLTDDGAEVSLAATAEEALTMLGNDAPDIVLSDVRMPGMDGIALLTLLRERAPTVDVIMMTGYDDMPTVAAAMRQGAVDFLVKPLDLHALRRVLSRVLEDRRVRSGSRATGEDPGSSPPRAQLVGQNPAMIEIFKLIGQAAANRATVLVRGESGTGKELIARAIHEHSADAAQPFIAVNCTALPNTLLESELFGHTRGAFTGAVSDRRGRFALAGRGTIFLDEIGDTTPEFQAKLLRVVEEREFYPVGAERTQRTDARVIAATHRNLEELVAGGRFRADLYYRLRIIEIRLPSLAERRSDLPLLADHLIRRVSATLGRVRPPVLSSEARELLSTRNWPGNVRELENCLTRAVVLASSDVIRPEHLSDDMTSAAAPLRLGTLAELEREHIERVLAATGGHKARAAIILGVSRPRLNRLLEAHGLE